MRRERIGTSSRRNARKALLLFFALVTLCAFVGCQKRQSARLIHDAGVNSLTVFHPRGHTRIAGQAASPAAPQRRAPSKPLEESKLLVKVYIPPETPKAAIASAGPGSGIAPVPAGDAERPAPGEGILLPPAAVQLGPESRPDAATLDPSLPLNMAPAVEPDWIEKAEGAIRERQGRNVAPDPNIGPHVDLSSPETPPSALRPAFSSDPTCQDEALGPFGAFSFPGYPPGSAPTGGPPDVTLTVGKDYVIAGYNSYFVVYNKGTGAQVAAFNMTSLFSGLTNCGSGTGSLCDPQVLYDDFNGGSCPSPTDTRYVLTALWLDAGLTDSRICIACSKSGLTPTSTGNFWTYELDPAGTGVADYPHIATGPDALIIGYNWFGTGYAAAAALSKSNLYNHTTPTVREYTFAPASTYRSPEPAVRVGCKQAQVPTYDGTHLVSRVVSTNALQLWRWPTPAASNNPVTYGSASLGSSNCTNPSGSYYVGTHPIDCFDGAYIKAEQRGDTLFTVRGAQSGTAALLWAKAAVSGASPTLTSGTAGESGNEIWMGSIASNSNNDFMLVYSEASQTNSHYIGTKVAGSESGVFGAPLQMKAGEAKYTNGVTDSGGTYWRWGDYNGAAPDPEDGCTFWANGQYARASTGIQDASWIAAYRFSTSCGVCCVPHLDSFSYSCYSTVRGTIIDTGGTPTNAFYHSTTGGPFPATISGGPNTYTASPVTIAQLGAADGDSVWLSFTGSDSATHNSTPGVVNCAVSVCVSKVDDLTGGCDNDRYMDRGETMNVFVQFRNNETSTLPTGFYADLRVDPAFPDADVTIVHETAEYAALDVGVTGYAIGRPFQVRCTGGANQRTVHFQVYNIRAIDGSWTGGSGCGAGNLQFTEVANANDALGASFTGFPESFDGAGFPPTNWTQVDVVGTALNWARSTNTSHPATGGTHSGAGLAFANSWTDYTVGDKCRLQRSIDTSTSGQANVCVSLWMFHDTQYSGTGDDYLEVQGSANSGGIWSTVGAPLVRTTGGNRVWLNHVVDMSSLLGNITTARVGLLATTEYGNDLHIDDVNFAPLVRGDDSSVCSTTPVVTLASSTQGIGYLLDEPQCNANGWADAGDSGSLLVYLSNSGSEDAYGVTATLTCPTCPGGVQICKGTANYGDIPYGSGYSYSQPDNGFQVAIPTGLAAGTALSWVVTVSATNPYSTTINIPTQPAQRSRSGTWTHVDNGCPNGYSIEDLFTTPPITSGTGGRCGFSTAWTCTSGVTGTGTAARLTGKSTTSPQTMAHTFSTVGVDGDVDVYWIFNPGRAATNSLFFFDYTNDGATWYNFISGGTGVPGQAAGADVWATYGYFSLYWQIYNQTGTGYGPAAANAILGNPNFGVRFRCTYASTTNSYWEVTPFFLDFFKWQNTATACTGVCLGPEAATISEVRDVHPCALTGVQVYFDKGIDTASTMLYVDGSPGPTGYTSGTTYTPGDSLSHNYTIRATNSYGNTNSSPAAPGIDAISTGTPTITCGACCMAPALLTTESGYANYQWYKSGAPIGGATSATYNAATPDLYTVSYKVGACSNTSDPKEVVIDCIPPHLWRVPEITPTQLATADHGFTGQVTWDSVHCASTSYHLLYGKGENLAAWVVDGGKCAIGTSGLYNWIGMPDPTTYTSRFLWFLVVEDDGDTKEGSWGLTYPGGAEEGGAIASGLCSCITKDTAGSCGTP